MDDVQLIKSTIDKFVDIYSEDLSVVLLQILAHKEQGGMGYSLEMFNPIVDMDGWEVDHNRKVIQIDRTGLIFNYDFSDYAEALKKAVETEFLKTRMNLLPRMAWGTGKVVLGLVETVGGAIGIIVPEPGTTVAGVVLVGLGTNNVVDGASQIFGANQGHGVNLLGSGFGYVGETVLPKFFDIDSATGNNIGQGIFIVSSFMAGSIASIKILRIPGKSFVSLGVGGQPDGVTLGRLQGLYQSARAGDGMTIININNNAGQSILRFVTHNGQLMANGRIVGVERVLVHATGSKEILKGLLKLLAHGAKY